MKDINDILFIIQARVNSERAPNKMIRPFNTKVVIGENTELVESSTNLFDIALKKVKKTKIPLENFRASVFDSELIKIVEDNNLLYYQRSEESANNDTKLQTIYEWHDKFPQFTYAILINACNLFLKPETIDAFIDDYCNTSIDGLFAVMPKKQYYWNENGSLITNWPDNNNIMNTKAVEQVYEAGHVLYAGKLEKIQKGNWMGKPPYSKNNPKLFEIDEFECLDIDFDWQFDLYTHYWEKLYG